MVARAASDCAEPGGRAGGRGTSSFGAGARTHCDDHVGANLSACGAPGVAERGGVGVAERGAKRAARGRRGLGGTESVGRRRSPPPLGGGEGRGGEGAETSQPPSHDEEQPPRASFSLFRGRDDPPAPAYDSSPSHDSSPSQGDQTHDSSPVQGWASLLPSGLVSSFGQGAAPMPAEDFAVHDAHDPIDVASAKANHFETKNADENAAYSAEDAQPQGSLGELHVEHSTSSLGDGRHVQAVPGKAGAFNEESDVGLFCVFGFGRQDPTDKLKNRTVGATFVVYGEEKASFYLNVWF